MSGKIETLGVLGSGTMGTGIAINAIVNGLTVRLFDTSSESLERAKMRAFKVLTRWVNKGRLSEKDKQAAMARLVPASLEEAAGSDLIIEAVFEDLGVKKALMQKIEPHLQDHAVVATNTSALKMADIAVALLDPCRMIGLHYFSPADVNPLCELISLPGTDERAIELAKGFLEQTKRVVLECGDTPGFIVNRFFIPLYDEAARILEEGKATAATIDLVSKDLFDAGAGLITVINVIGSRTAYHAAVNLAQIGPDYDPCDLLASLADDNSQIELQTESEQPDDATRQMIEQRLLGALMMPVFELLDQGHARIDQIDTGAQHALKYNRTPGHFIISLGRETLNSYVSNRRATRKSVRKVA